MTCGVAQIRQVKTPLATLSGTITVSERVFGGLFKPTGMPEPEILAGKAGSDI